MELYIGVALAIIAAIAWGVNSHIVKKAMEKENAMRAIGIRALFTFPILFAIIFYLQGSVGITRYLDPDVLPFVLLTAFLVVLGDGIFLHGLKYHDVSLLLPISSVYPLVTTAMLIVTGTETVTNNVVLGTLIIIIGVSIVTSKDGTKDFKFDALLYGFGAALSWGISIFFVKYILDQDGTEPIGLTGVRTFFMMVSSFILLLVLFSNNSSYQERERDEIVRTIKLLAASGIIGWVIGATIFFMAVDRIGAAIPTPVSSTNPIIASLIGFSFGFEKITRKQFFGILMTVFGTIVVLI